MVFTFRATLLRAYNVGFTFATAIEFFLLKQVYTSRKSESDSRQVNNRNIVTSDRSGRGVCGQQTLRKEKAGWTAAVGYGAYVIYSTILWKSQMWVCSCVSVPARVCECLRAWEICLVLVLRDYPARCNSPHVKYKTTLTGREVTGSACFFPSDFVLRNWRKWWQS